MDNIKTNIKVELAKYKLLLNSAYGGYGAKKDSRYYEWMAYRSKLKEKYAKIIIRKRKIEKLCQIK
jgi:hypothetical protein